MSRYEVEANVILLTEIEIWKSANLRLKITPSLLWYSPTVDRQSCHHNTCVSLFFANINGSSITCSIRIIGFDQMRLVDEYIGIDVGRINPIAAEILWQSTARFDNFRFHRCNSHSLRWFFGRFQCIAFGRNGHTNVQIVVTIFQETTIFLIFTTFFCIGDGEIVIFANEPIA